MPNSAVIDAIGLMVGVVLTLLIFSYLLGDNPLYRLALHLFIGVVVGYSFGVVLREVVLLSVLPQLVAREQTIVIPVVLGILLLMKGFPRYAYIGNFSVAYLVGVGTAVALAGALMGSIIPQVGAVGNALSRPSDLFGLGDGLIVLLGTICTLMAFTFAVPARRGVESSWARSLRGLARVGRLFLIIAFGVAFAGALTAALTMFIGRVQSIIDVVLMVF